MGRKGGKLQYPMALALASRLVLWPALPGLGQAPDWERIDLPDGAIFQDPGWVDPGRFLDGPPTLLAADRAGRLCFANGPKLHVGDGSGWKTLSKPKPSISPQRPLAAGFEGQVMWGEWRSRDGGASWDSLGRPFRGTACAVLGDGTGLRGSNSDIIERSQGYSDAWTRVHEGRNFGYIRQFAMGGSAIFALPAYGQILFSLDSGHSWRPWSTGTQGVAGETVQIGRFQNPSLGTPLILALSKAGNTRNTLLRLHVYYPALDTLEGALPDSAITSLWFDQDRTLWLGTRGQGVHVSRDGGMSFTAVNAGLGSLHVEALESTSDGILHALTRDGLYRARAGSTGIPSLRPMPSPRSPDRARLHLAGLPASLQGDSPKARLSVLADGRIIILPTDTPNPR